MLVGAAGLSREPRGSEGHQLVKVGVGGVRFGLGVDQGSFGWKLWWKQQGSSGKTLRPGGPLTGGCRVGGGGVSLSCTCLKGRILGAGGNGSAGRNRS